MKKVLIFSLAYYPSFTSGAEIAIKEITDRISPEKIEFHMVTLHFDPALPREEKLGNVVVHRVGWGGNYFTKICFPLLAALAARRLDRVQHFDAIWVMMTYMLFPAVLARGLGVRAPYALTLQDGDPYEKVFERWFIRPVAPLLDYGFRHAAIIQTISTYLATWPALRGSKAPVIVVPNGFSPASATTYPPQEIEELKAEVGKKEGETLLVSVSRLVHQKGIDTIIRALALLPTTVRLIVVGDGLDRSMLEHLVDKLGVRERVTFVGQVDRTMTAKYRQVADIFVSPSRSEGQGIAFLSTMVAGLPIIATQEGGLADFIFDAKRNLDKPTTAWAVDRDSPEQIAEAVKDIMAHPKKARAVAATARHYALEHYDWVVIARTMQDKVFAPVMEAQ